MTELQKMIVQAANEAYKSDLMASFVSDYKGQLSQSLGASDPAYLSTTTTTSGPRFFAPPPPSSSSSSASTTTTTTTATASPIDCTDNANVLNQATDNVPKSTDDDSNRNTINANVNTTTTSSNTTTSSTTTSTSTTSGAATEGPDSNANMSEVAAVLEEVRGSVPETKKMLVQKLTETTAEAHSATCINTLQAVREARARFESSQTSMPDMSKLSLSATAMWDKMKEQMMPELAKTITFFKQLAGFNELCLDDQMLLIKQGTFEVMVTRFCLLIDHVTNTMLDPSHHMVCPREVIQKMPMGGFLDGFFRVGASFNPLGLSDAEVGVFTAVLAFSPSRPGLKEPRLIGTIQALYLRALFNLMRLNHTDAENKFCRVLGLAPMFRAMSEEHSKALGAMKAKAPADFSQQFTPVHSEMYLQHDQ